MSRNILIRLIFFYVNIFWQLPKFKKNINWNSTAWIPKSGNSKPFRFDAIDNVFGDLHGAIFVKSAVIAIRK